MRHLKSVIGILVWTTLLPLAFANGSPQWQGPDRNAISQERGLLKEWPKEGPPLAWKVKGIGGGYSAPPIAAGRTFGMNNLGDEEAVWARSEKDGQTLWTTPLGPVARGGMPQGKEGPGCTPTVDGDRAPKGSLALADGRLYYRAEKGTMLLIEPNAKQYVEHGRFDQPERSAQLAWPHPVFANDKLYLRDQDVLLCYDVKAK